MKYRRPEIGKTFFLVTIEPSFRHSYGWRTLHIAFFKPKCEPPQGEVWGKQQMQWGFWWQIHFFLPVIFDRTPR